MRTLHLVAASRTSAERLGTWHQRMLAPFRRSPDRWLLAGCALTEATVAGINLPSRSRRVATIACEFRPWSHGYCGCPSPTPYCHSSVEQPDTSMRVDQRHVWYCLRGKQVGWCTTAAGRIGLRVPKVSAGVLAIKKARFPSLLPNCARVSASASELEAAVPADAAKNFLPTDGVNWEKARADASNSSSVLQQPQHQQLTHSALRVNNTIAVTPRLRAPFSTSSSPSSNMSEITHPTIKGESAEFFCYPALCVFCVAPPSMARKQFDVTRRRR